MYIHGQLDGWLKDSWTHFSTRVFGTLKCEWHEKTAPSSANDLRYFSVCIQDMQSKMEALLTLRSSCNERNHWLVVGYCKSLGITTRIFFKYVEEESNVYQIHWEYIFLMEHLWLINWPMPVRYHREYQRIQQQQIHRQLHNTEGSHSMPVYRIHNHLEDLGQDYIMYISEMISIAAFFFLFYFQ